MAPRAASVQCILFPSVIRNTDRMDFANVEAFVAVVDCAGFTRAAHQLHLSQPALSRRIALLEHRLRQSLFERGRRGIRLTDAGETFLPHARAALACLRDGAAAVRELEHGAAGTLTLAIVGTLASTGVAEQLGRFRAAHPGVRLLLRTGTSAEVSSLVRRGEATLGLRYFADPAADLVSRHLYREPLVAIAAAAHPLAKARRVAAARLRGESWVAFPARRGAAIDPFGQALTRALVAAGLDAAEIVPIDSLTAQKRLVEAGFGLALVPASAVREELGRGSLRILDVPAIRGRLDVVAIQRRNAFVSRAARSLLETLAETPRELAARRRAPTRRGR
jgi:DNA-binding transcriptional LysR family regulator